MPVNPNIFIPLLVVSLMLFSFSCYKRFSLVTLGGPEERTGAPWTRVLRVLTYAIGQKRVLARPFGLNHLVIFWSFLVLLLANGEFLLKGIFPKLGFSLLPAPVYQLLLLSFDLVSLAVLASVSIAAVRRVVSPPYKEARTIEAFVILVMIAVLMLAYFAMHGAEIAMGVEVGAQWMPVSGFVAALLVMSPFANDLVAVATTSWWLHAVVFLAFMNYLPISKHMHILTAIPNCFFASLKKPNTQPREEFVRGNSFGAAEVNHLTWKDLFDGFSCTECGRCQNACPAFATGKPLNPRRVIHEIKANLLENGPLLFKGLPAKKPLIGDATGCSSEEALWSCTTCGACMEACPVFIEQMPKIVKMRRHLVQEKAQFPEELLNLFENMEQRSNPWGIAPSERVKWHSGMEVRQFEAGKTEYLLYVGCAGAFDSRQKHVTVALASILDAAGVSWGILGKEEPCCGDSARRLGNEYLFDLMAKENAKLFREKGITNVITQCPHCFSTLKNDYQQYGMELRVMHHTEMIDSLIESGKLRFKQTQSPSASILFHDSCYLGRHNDVFDAPRRVIAAATSAPPLEMERSKENSFCCGAGGGRMWLEERSGTRINLNRIGEALALNPETVCVSCPYCLTMFEDGLKDLQSEKVRVRDIAEVVAEGLRC